jgi:hypothetical protein
MELNQEIDRIEYDGWSRDFIGHLIVVACGFSLMMVYIFRLPTYADEWWVLLLGIFIISYSARKAWVLFFSVPRRIVLKQNTLSFVFSNGVIKEYSYKDVSRLVVGSYEDDGDLIVDDVISFNKNYKIQIYISQSDHKLLMDSLRYSNFKALIYILQEKGINQVIQKR